MTNLKNKFEKNVSNNNETKTVFSQSVLDKLNAVEIKESIINKKSFLYKFQNAENKLSERDAKKQRSKLRNELQRIINNIIIYAKQNKIEDLKIEKEKLLNYQKENLINSEFKVNSFYQGSDTKKLNELTICIEVCSALDAN